ncbi:MAG: hypothetical protein IT480_08390 [Gammaproteobacteria bacterium]|nr:hypothetical protein [Gammaproteobacteria bacterium]
MIGGRTQVHTLMFYSPSRHDDHLEGQARYPAGEQQDPAASHLLRRLQDCNPVRN